MTIRKRVSFRHDWLEQSLRLVHPANKSISKKRKNNTTQATGITLQSGSQIFLDQRFDSFSQLSDLTGWGAEFRQLSAEKFSPKVFQGRISSLLLSNGRFGCQLDQRGTTPEGMRTFVVPNSNCSEFRWYGRTVKLRFVALVSTSRRGRGHEQTGL